MNRSRVQPWVPQSALLCPIYIWSTLSKGLSVLPHTPQFWYSMWMTYLSSKRKSINRTSYNTSTVLTLPFRLQWRTTRRMGPLPSWAPLLNHRLMGNCLPLCTGNPPALTSTYSGTVTITSQPSLLLSTPSPIGPKQYAAILSFSTEMTHLRNAQIHCKYPKWALDEMERRLNKPSSEASDGANNQGITGAQPATKEVKTKGHIVIPYTQDLCESIKKICGRYGIQMYFKGSNTIRHLLVSPKDKDPMVNQSGAIYWFQCGDLPCDGEYIGETSRTLMKDTKSTLRTPHPFINTVTIQATPPVTITSK